MQKEILEKLYKPFELKSRQGQGGKTFQYVESDDIINRMNEVFAGEWSTQIVEREMIEDHVLVRVRVSVNVDGFTYSHEGYASQAMARFSLGDKKGQVIDVGNVFKSAVSKAIKTAVSRWGVGLYLEKSSDSELMPEIPIIPSVDKEMPKATAFNAPPMPETPKPSTVSIPKTASVMPPIPDVPTPPADKPVVPVFDFPPADLPVFTDDIVVKTNGVQSPTPPTVAAPAVGGKVEMATDIQKVAIEVTMAINNLTFEELAVKSLNREDNLPKSVDDLTYTEAVHFIKYGNNLKEKK